MSHHHRILFICKRNECYGFTTYTRRSAGLFNSTRFIVESLEKHGVQAKIIEVLDNNDIDREVTKYNPDIVVIEALWVVPEKFDILKPLHPNVKWYVHLHSNMPFLALEGIAIEWILGYKNRDIGLIANSPESYDALRVLLSNEELIYLPNVYLSHPKKPSEHKNKVYLDIGCFGAMRPLKNHLLQALAAIRFSMEIGKPLRFHVNASRIETGGEPVMKNIIALFSNVPGTKLIEHHWMEPDEFIHFLHGHIDIGMQVSLTETFNVVTADYVTAGVPSVVSKEVVWVSDFCKALDDEIDDIVRIMHRVYKCPLLVKRNQKLLLQYSKHAQDAWFKFVS